MFVLVERKDIIVVQPEYFGDNLEKVGSETQFIPNTSTYGNREIGGTTCPGILADSFALTL